MYKVLHASSLKLLSIQASSMGFPQIQTSGKRQVRFNQSRLDLLLKRRDCNGFHNSPCGLCLHLSLLAETYPHTGFCGWLGPGLDAAKAWDGEHTCLLDLLLWQHSQSCSRRWSKPSSSSPVQLRWPSREHPCSWPSHRQPSWLSS